MVLLRNTCLNCSFLRQLGHLVTVSDPLTATSSSCRQLNCLHMDGVLLLHQAKLCGTASPNTSATQHYPLIRLGAILSHTFCSILIYTRRLSALETLWLHALCKFFYCDCDYYAALLPRRGPHIASHSVCLSVRLSARPVIAYLRISVTCFRQPCGRAVSFVLFTCQGRI